MLIGFQFSGGYGGLFAKQPLSICIDTDNITVEERNELLTLLKSSGLLDTKLTSTAMKSTRHRDVFTYRLTIREQEMEMTFSFDDTTVPVATRPLLAFLKQLAIEKKNAVN